MDSSLRLQDLVLEITASCPLECAHCCVESGPRRRETMSLDDATSWIGQAATINPAVHLHLTGGEPFARFRLMTDIATSAHEHGIGFTVITSAIWARSQDIVRRRLAPLVESGLYELDVSFDEFHLPWVSVDVIRNCVTVASELGMKVVIRACVTRYTTRARELLGDWVDQLDGVRIREQPVSAVGRAASFNRDQLLVEDWGEINLRCPARGELLIRWDGSAFLCTTSNADHLALGNARTVPISELRQDAEAKEWFQIITSTGFRELERRVQLYESEAKLPRQFAGVCDLCQLTFGSGELGATVREALSIDPVLGTT